MHADFDGIVALLIALVSSALSAFSWIVTYKIAAKIEAKQENSENRRYFYTVWKEMSELSHIDPEKPTELHVRTKFNTLQFIAGQWQAGVLDKDMAVQNFGRLYLEYVEELRKINTIVPVIGKNGHQLLLDAPEITSVGNEIQKCIEDRISISKGK